jgi:hypothetical protein
MTATKYAIPGGYDFAEGIRTGHAPAFFAHLAHSGVNPELIDPKKDVVVVRNDGGDWSLTASTLDGATGTWPLGLPTAPVIEWLEEEFGVKTAALDDVQSRIDKLATARKRAAEAKEEADELRAEILGIMTARKAKIGTVGGVPVIAVKTIPQAGRFDRKGFEAEYPTIAARFTGPETTQTRLEFI